MTAEAERGFTLLEMLVAMAVLSLGALALLNLAGENTRTAGAVEARLFAGMVAENQAVLALTSAAAPAFGRESGVEEAGLRRWRWTRTVSRTADPDISRIEVRVREEGARGVTGEVVVFRGRA